MELTITVHPYDPVEFLLDAVRQLPRSHAIQLIKAIDKELMQDWNFTATLYSYFKSEMDQWHEENIRESESLIVNTKGTN